MDCYARPLGWMALRSPHTHGGVALLCAGSVLSCWLGFGFGSDAIYYLERHRLGGNIPVYWTGMWYHFCCCLAALSAVRVCACGVAHLLLLPCVLFHLSIHPSIAIHCIRNSYCVGGRSLPFTIHIYESAKLDLLDVVVLRRRRRERASKRAVLTRYYTQRRQRGRFPLNPQNATVPRYDTMQTPLSLSSTTVSCSLVTFARLYILSLVVVGGEC